MTGFEDIELVAETGFNSSPVTKGVLFRATKLTDSQVEILEERDLDFFAERDSVESRAEHKEEPGTEQED